MVAEYTEINNASRKEKQLNL